MIARLWHGSVPTEKADAYRAFLIKRAVPDYHYVAGNLDVKILERRDGDVTHFIMLTYWENYDVIRSFAGKDINKAKYYPEDKDFLLEFEPTVIHYEVVGEADEPTVRKK